jgi:choice-of-anchor B domain-containing protein
MRAFLEDVSQPQNLPALASTACVGGFAGIYPCENVDLKAFVPLADIGGDRANSAANDIWGWTDPETNKEYAIVGRVFGTSFVDISDPANPVYLGELVTHGAFGSPWRDIKVYNDHAFIVSEARGHGMQVFDLTQLRNVTNPPVDFSETAHYNKMSTAHNIVINEDSGYAYVVGASGKNSCSGGLHMVDINVPTSPQFAGCYSDDGYTHDAQCVNYNGLDVRYTGSEICFNSNEDTLTIVDVTDKSNPTMLSRTGYAGVGYTHQGWLTENHAFFLLDDELDEATFGHNTRTRIWDLSELDNITETNLIAVFEGATSAIDHNLYVQGDCAFEANYRAGLSILDIRTISTPSEIGYFDIYPADDLPEFNAAWSNYPYFASGTVVVSGIEQGLFVLTPNLPAVVDGGPDCSMSAPPPPPPPTTIHVGDLDGVGVTVNLRRGTWEAGVTITVHNENENPVANATVTGAWSTKGNNTASCVTDSNSQCSVIKSGLKSNTASVTFSVTNIVHGSDAYASADNHDPDGDSNGTSINVLKP